MEYSTSKYLENDLERLTPKGEPWSVALALSDQKDRELFLQGLNQLGIEFVQQTVQGESLPETFDMIVLDESRFTDGVRRQLREVKERQEPLFTPILTLTPEEKRERLLVRYGELTDEFLVRPLEGGVVNTRIGNLLHLRYLSEELEIKYRAITQNAYELISIFDEDGSCLFANRNHEKLLGYAPDELVGRTVGSFLLEDEQHEKLEEDIKEFTGKVEKRGNGYWGKP